MIFAISEIRKRIKPVADRYDIEFIRLFGSYANSCAKETSDVDMIVAYGDNCRGLTCIRFMDELEDCLGKSVDVLNVDYLPSFLQSIPMENFPLLYAKLSE